VYTDYWHLKRKPFENSPDSTFFYYSEGHRVALDHMLYAMRERKSLALLTGDYGCGKTTLVWAVAKALKPEMFVTGIVNNPRLSEIDMLNEILYQLGEDRQSERMLELSRMIADLLFRNVKEDKHTVLMIDEAQLIEDEGVLEQLRLLLNYQLQDRCMLTLMLVGQLELDERVKSLPQLDQRVAVRCHLAAFSPEDVGNYVRHRLRISGVSEPIFSDEAIRAVHSVTGGIPRRINNVCDLALMQGAKQKLERVTPDLVNSVA